MAAEKASPTKSSKTRQEESKSMGKSSKFSMFVEEWYSNEENSNAVKEHLQAVKRQQIDLDYIYKDMQQVDTFFSEGQHSFAAILEQLLLISYVIIDQFVDEEERATGVYRALKARCLKHIYTCLYWVKPKERQLHKSLVAEIFEHDLSQLTEEERRKVPADYIKRLCFIAIDTPRTESAITDEEL